MSFRGFLKVNTAATLKAGPFVDNTDGYTPETALTLNQADTRLSKNGGDFAQKNNATSAAHDEIGYYDVYVDTADVNTEGQLAVAFNKAGALPVIQEYAVLGEGAWDSMFGASDGKVAMPVDVVSMNNSTAAANNHQAAAANLAAAAANYSATRGLAGTALPAAAADGAGGLPISDAGGLDLDTQIGTDIDAILTDTNELQTDDIPGTLATIAGYLDTEIAAILEDTGTTLPATLTTLQDKLLAYAQLLARKDAAIATDRATELGEINNDEASGGGAFDNTSDSQEAIRDKQTDIETDTGEIGAAGAGLTALPWNAAWDAEVQSECADALTAYDPPTKTEMDTMQGVLTDEHNNTQSAIAGLNDPAASAIADAVWEEATADHGNGGTTGLALASAGNGSNAADIADAVWEEAIADHNNADTFGSVTQAAGSGANSADIADAVWNEAAADHVTAGNFGKVLQDANNSAANANTNAAQAATNANNAKASADTANTTAGNVETAVGALNDLSAAQAEVACNNSIAAYDPPTKAELDSAVSPLSTLDAANVNAEIVDALNVDTYAEPGQGAPAANTSLVNKLGYLYKSWRNKKIQDANNFNLYNDAGDTVDQKATVSSDNNNTTFGEIGTGA
jgi:hypothetical protein